MGKLYHYGRYVGGRLQAASFVAAVKAWPEGTMLKFTVDQYIESKTLPQNNFLHLLFGIAARAMNKDSMGDGSQWTLETVKQHCKDAKLYPVVDRLLPGGQIVQVTLDTRHLNKEQMGQTIDRVMRYFLELGIHLPSPDEQQEMNI